MTGHQTCVNQRFDSAPARRVLRGDRRAKSEPGTHIIEFPGGAIELARLDDGSYWAHIIVNRRDAGDWGAEGLKGARGTVIDSRIDWDERHATAIPCVPDGAHLTQLAVRILPAPLRGEAP